MMDKRFVESFLRLNNVGANASAAEIKTVLTQAHWPSGQIKEALALHNGGVSAAERFHETVFRPDMDWSPSQLSSLLGIDVVVDPGSFRMSASSEVQLQHIGRKVLVGLSASALALAIAALLGFCLMYFFEVGPFYTETVDII